MFIIKDLLHWLSPYRLKLIVLSAAAVWGTVWVWPWLNRLNIVFCSVGQGDATIVVLGFTQVLIDAGPASPRRSSQSEGGPVTDCLARRLPFFDHRLEAVIISHPQTDHFGGLAAVLNRYQVDKFIFNGFAGDSKSWADLSGLIAAEKSQIISLSAGDKLKIGEIEINILWPAKGSDLTKRSDPFASVLGVSSSRDLNADALVLKLNYGNFSALFTGDIGEKEESVISSRFFLLGSLPAGRHGESAGFQSAGLKPINRQPANSKLTTDNRKPITVLKVAHHGSKTSSSAEFLQAVRPALAVIEVGKNSYGHPADEVIKRLEGVGAKILRTDKDGDVVVKSDGKSWQVSNGF